MSDLKRIQNVIDAGQMMWFPRSDVELLQFEIQRLREALEGVQRIIQSAAFYDKANDYKSVLTSAGWASQDALSPEKGETPDDPR